MQRHPRLDIQKWVDEFSIWRRLPVVPVPGQEVDDALSLDFWLARGAPVSSPYDLAVVEQVRRATELVASLGPPTPTDLFLMSPGPGEEPSLTRMGGVPHRPADQPWPTTEAGTPYTFVAQFSFVDSQDLMHFELPGDLLLVYFAAPDSPMSASLPEGLYFEWQPAAIARPMRREQVPPPCMRVPELHAQILRTAEYPKSYSVFAKSGFLEWWLFIKTQATRIGGSTFFPNNDPRKVGLISRDAEFLCSLNSVVPRTFPDMGPYPLVADRPLNLSREEAEALSFLVGDNGCLYIFLDEEGVLHWQAHG